MFGFDPGVSDMNSSGFKSTIPVFNGKQESFSRWKQESVIYSRRMDLTRCLQGRMIVRT